MATEDFSDARALKQHDSLRPSVEERHRPWKCFYDLSDMRSRHFNAIAAQVVFILLTYTLRQFQLWKLLEQQIASWSPDRMRFRLAVRREYVIIYHQNAYTQMPLLSFSRELLEFKADAHAKALKKIIQLEQSMLQPFENLRPP